MARGGATEEYEAVDAIHRDMRSWRALLDRVHNLLALCRAERIVHINPAGAKLLGYDSSGPLLGQEVAALFHPDYRDFAALGLEMFAEEEGKIPLKLLRADGGTLEIEVWVTRMEGVDPPLFVLEGHDITAHLHAARELRSREQRLAGIINTVADGILTVDQEGVVHTFNPAAERIFGFSADEVLGRGFWGLLARDAGPGCGEELPGIPPLSVVHWLHSLSETPETVGCRKDGSAVPLEMTVGEMKETGGATTFTIVVRDITVRKEAEQKLFQLAHHDALTGLPNRHLVRDRIQEAIKRGLRQQHRLAVLYIDLDRFKPINDTLGHAAGDIVLREVSQRLARAVRKTDTVARVGGDEFLVLLEGISSSKEVEAIAWKLIFSVEEPVVVAECECQVGASVGVALFPDHASTLEGILEAADRAMYTVKNRGRGTVHVLGTDVTQYSQ